MKRTGPRASPTVFQGAKRSVIGSPNGRSRLWTVRLGDRRAVLPDVGSHKPLDPRVVRQIVDDLGLKWEELPGPSSRV